MNNEHIKNLLTQGEGVSVEFKECRTNINRSVYETVCAFLNRIGGEILLGVNDDGVVTGVAIDKIEQMKKDFVTSLNNPTKISPTYYLTIKEFILGDKHIIYIYVPMSSEVHRCNQRFFDRNNDADIDITNNNYLVHNLFSSKQKESTENTVYPYLTIDDFNKDVIAKVRNLAINRQNGHIWANLSDIDLIKSAGFYKIDSVSGIEGFTLGGILLCGKDSTILSVVSYYKTDAILRRINLDRYDDRDIVQTNLIDSYEQLMAFIVKWLPDPFYLNEKQQRISLRDKVFREVVSNSLIHREYLNAYPAKLIIEQTRVVIENANRAHTHGKMFPTNFSPFPKNPLIAKFFREIGWADELGSGVRNLFKYTKEYSAGKDPQLIEEDIFTTVIPLDERFNTNTLPKFTPQATPQAIKRLLNFCTEPRSRSEMQVFLGLSDRKYFTKCILKLLIEQGKLHPTIPEKPTSPKQRYYSIGK